MATPIPPVAIKISAQNEALRELEKARAEIVRLTDTAKRNFGQAFPQATRASTEGLHAVRSGMQALAFQAAGIPGPIGKVSSGLLTLAGGSSLVLGVTAGIAAIGIAFKLSSDEVNKFSDANQKAQETLRAITVQGHPEIAGRLAGHEQIGDLQGQLASARGELAAALHPPSITTGRGGTVPGIIDEAKVTNIRTLITTLTQSLDAARDHMDDVLHGPGRDFITQLEHERDLVGVTARRAGELRAEWAKLGPAEVRAAGEIAAQTAARTEEVRVLKEQRDIMAEILLINAEVEQARTSVMGFTQGIPLGLPKDIGDVTPEHAKEQAGIGFFKDTKAATRAITDLEHAMQASADAAAAAALAHQQAAISIINSVSAIVSGIVGGGGAGGFLSGLGGLVSSVIPGGKIAGAVLGGLGAVVSSADSGAGHVVIDGYTQRALDQQRKEEDSKRNIVILQTVDRRGNVRDEIYDVTRYQNRGGTAGGITSRSDGSAVTTRTG